MKKSALFKKVVSLIFLGVLFIAASIQADITHCDPVAVTKSNTLAYDPVSEVTFAILQEDRAGDFSPEKVLAEREFVTKALAVFGPLPTSEALATYNASGCIERRVSQLDGETLLLLAKTYDHFLVIAEKNKKPALRVSGLADLQKAFIAFKPLAANATKEEQLPRLTALGELFTMVVKFVMKENKFFIYEYNAGVVDQMSATLGVSSTTREDRYIARKLLDPAHRIFATLLIFAPLILMACMQSTLAHCVGVDHAAMAISLSQLVVIANIFLLGKNDIIRCLAMYNPISMVTNIILRCIRDGGHWMMDCTIVGHSTARLEMVAKAVHILGICCIAWRVGGGLCSDVFKALGATYNSVVSAGSHVMYGAVRIFEVSKNSIFSANAA